eukprot:m.160206 g.160206  ORF g.160206 m.160206 type:complete len:92 (+) comp31174_c0_seq1:266-541(+)
MKFVANQRVLYLLDIWQTVCSVRGPSWHVSPMRGLTSPTLFLCSASQSGSVFEQAMVINTSRRRFSMKSLIVLQQFFDVKLNTAMFDNDIL